MGKFKGVVFKSLVATSIFMATLTPAAYALEIQSQYETGKYSLENCGPTVLSMVLEHLGFELQYVKAEDIRNEIKPSSGLITVDQMYNYLKKKKVNTSKVDYKDLSSLDAVLDKGELAIICIDSSEIPVDYYGRSYEGGGPHFVIISDKTEEGRYIVYDPAEIYGHSVEWEGEDINKAIKNWWNGIITVGETEVKVVMPVEEKVVMPAQ